MVSFDSFKILVFINFILFFLHKRFFIKKVNTCLSWLKDYYYIYEVNDLNKNWGNKNDFGKCEPENNTSHCLPRDVSIHEGVLQ